MVSQFDYSFYKIPVVQSTFFILANFLKKQQLLRKDMHLNTSFHALVTLCAAQQGSFVPVNISEAVIRGQTPEVYMSFSSDVGLPTHSHEG